ncbi:MAG TPA: glycoside hydrolase family 3 C-terminal domain-containing protein [Spirochaetia bacterium]|nr:glycoside hydrolase family 3 C-terminal domain-containing protein [Spirochaetia bacterium]
MAKLASAASGAKTTLKFQDEGLPVAERVRDLVSRLTLDEKVSQMVYQSAAIPRLDIPEYNWWNECLHGVGRAGIATVFPQAIAMGATFDPPLIEKVATAIADEARAKHHEFVRNGDRRIFKGLTFWTPNINIFRDPRWGRGQETYGEDPYLTGRMGVAFVKGLQGDDPKYLKLVATPKHYAVHSGPEALRHHFNAIASPKDLRETYLPAFKECVVEGKAVSIMGAYNRTNDEPCCASPTLLEKILREEWGFDGYVVSDCGAIADFHLHHMVTSTPEKSAALAVNNGCDLNCGRVYDSLVAAVKQGLISEKTIDRALSRLFTARFRLGMFDAPEHVPYAQIPIEVNDSPEHRKLALATARESIVLLKNAKSILPLSETTGTIAVIGPNADSHTVLLGNYNGFPSSDVTILEGIRRRVSSKSRVIYAQGCELVAGNDRAHRWGRRDDDGFAEACSAANRADVVVMCLGISATLEGEEGAASQSEWQGDRIHIDLPEIQQRLLEAVAAIGKPIVLVLASGSAVAIEWADKNVPAILACWYPGEEGGTAVAEVLFGDYNPSGRLPVTFVRSLDQLPPFTDYRMAGRTYRYMTEEPLYPFGYGLSYTTFEYRGLELSKQRIKPGEAVRARVKVRNSGKIAGDEVAELYLSDLEASVAVPSASLAGVKRLRLKPGEEKEITFDVPARRLALIDDEGRCVLEPGTFRVSVGGSQPDSRSASLLGRAPVSAELIVEGEATEIPY